MDGIPGTHVSFAAYCARRMIAVFLQDRTPALADATRRTYERKLKTFHQWWRVHEPTTPLNETVARRYAHWLHHDVLVPASRPSRRSRGADHETPTRTPEQGRSRSLASQGLHLSAVRQWCLFLMTKGELPTNPFTPIAGPPRARWLRHHLLTRPDLQRLLQQFDQDDPVGCRDYLIAALMIRAGARESALAAATIGDLTEYGQEGRLLFLRSKGKTKQEPVIVRPDLSAKLWRYLHDRYPGGTLPQEDPLFTNQYALYRGERMTTRGMRKQLKEAFTQAGLARPYVTALSLRLSGGAHAYRKGASPSEVKRTMRHESLRTTQVLIDQVNRLRFGAERYLDDIT